MGKHSNKRAYVTENGISFTEKQVNFLIEYTTIGGLKGRAGSSMDAIRTKILKAYPEWEKMTVRGILYRFVYKEGLVKL